MNNLFLVLVLVSILCLIVGLIKPSLLKLQSRKKAALVFGGSTILCFVLFGVTAPPTPPASMPAVPAQTASTAPQPATPAPSSPATLTDKEYWQQFSENVEPFIATATQEMSAAGTAEQAHDFVGAQTDCQQVESTLSQAQAGLQALEGTVPPDVIKINTLANKFVSDYTQACKFTIIDLNSDPSAIKTNKPVDVDVFGTVVTSLMEGNAELQQMNTDMQQLNQ